MSASIKVSELPLYPPPPLAAVDFFPIVNSSSMFTQRTTLSNLANFLSASVTMSWALTASYLLYKGFFDGSASYALAGGNSAIAFSASWASRSLSSSWADTASYVVTYPNSRYVPYVDANNLLTTTDYFLRFDSASAGQTFTGEPVMSSEDVQILFNERQNKYSVNYCDLNILRLIFKGTSSIISPSTQNDEAVKIIAGSKTIKAAGPQGGGHPQKILGLRGGSSKDMTVRYYAGYRIQSSSFGSDMDAYGWNGIYTQDAHVLPTETYFPPYPVPVMSLMGTYDYNLIKFKEGVCRSVRRYADAAVLTESFWQPFSALRISMDSASNPNTSGSVDISPNNKFWIPHYRPYSNVASTINPRIDFNTVISENLYDYYESVNSLYIGEKVVIEPTLTSQGIFDTGSLPAGYFRNSGSFNGVVKIISTGSVTYGYGFILECVNPAVIPNHIYASGMLEMAPNQTLYPYLGGSGSISPGATVVFTITSGSNQTKNRFLLTSRLDSTFPPASYYLPVGYTFTASFSPVYSVEYADTQGTSFYLLPMSCSTEKLAPIGLGAPVNSPYIADANLSQSYWFYNFVFGTFYSATGNYSHKTTTGNTFDFENGRPKISGVASGSTLKIKRTITAASYENNSKTKQIVYFMGPNNGSQISASFFNVAIGGIVDGFVDGQELTVCNTSTNVTLSFFGRTHPFIAITTASIYPGTKIILPTDAQKLDLLPNQSVNFVYDSNYLMDTSATFWRTISTSP